MTTKTYTKIRERQPRGKLGTFMAYFWTGIYTWLGIASLVAAAQANVDVTNLVVLSFFVLVALRSMISYEFDGKWWSKWRNYEKKGNNEQ